MIDNDNFISVPFSPKNLDRYYIRSSILSAIKEVLPQLNGNLLDIGCGKMPYKNYILENSLVKNYTGLDIEGALEYDSNVKPDYVWNGKVMPFDNFGFECAFGTEVLEHCPDPTLVLKEVYRVLKPHGIFFFTVPFLWNLHEVPNDEYRFTPFSLERHLKESGFSNIKITASGGWHASLAQMLGLWVRRAPMNKMARGFLSICFKPVINYLLSKDSKRNIQFTEGQMITGLYGTARK